MTQAEPDVKRERTAQSGWNWAKTHPESEAHKRIVNAEAERRRRGAKGSRDVVLEVKRSLSRAGKGR